MLYLNLLHNKSFTKLTDWTKYVLLHSVNPSLILFVLRFAAKFSDCIKWIFELIEKIITICVGMSLQFPSEKAPSKIPSFPPDILDTFPEKFLGREILLFYLLLFQKNLPTLHHSIIPLRTTINLLDSIFRGQYVNYVSGEGTFSNQNFKWPERMLNNNIKTSSGT